MLIRRAIRPRATRRRAPVGAVLVCLVASLSVVADGAALHAQQSGRRPPIPTRGRSPLSPPRLDTLPKADSIQKKDSTATRSDSAAGADAAAAVAVASLAGVVYDSLHEQPLADAVVMLEGTQMGARTSNLGLFTIDSIPPGSYRVRVRHVLLDSIGIQMLTNEFPLGAGDERTVQLAIPSPASLVAVSCPAARRALGPSAVIGRLLDADTDKPVAGARVSVAWLQMSINAGLRKVPITREALSAPDGVYRICGLPAELEGTLQAINKGIQTAEVRLKFEGQPLIVQGLKIGNANTVTTAANDSLAKGAKPEGTGPSFSAPVLQTGSALLSGRVLNAAGQPMKGARVDVTGTPGHTLTSDAGEFSLDSLPSGTQSVVARQIGYAPVEKAVELSTRSPARVSITMSQPAQVLATVVVKADRDVGLDKVGFTQRKKSGLGSYLTADDIMKRGPNLLTDVFRTVPGLRVTPSGTDYVVESSRNVTSGCVKYFVDGAVWDAIYPGDVDRLVPPWEISAIEVYNGASTPAQFQWAGQSSCTAVVIWTKSRTDIPQGRR
jgi:Carboxypeptidase regulatory-like domain/TonB-dependent Receptor Plug Domain